MPFYAAALETLESDSAARVLVVYPMKALGREQEDRWRQALRAAEVGIHVGRIDGQVPVTSRPEIVKRCRVLIVTPDIVHAWVLSNLSNPAVVGLLRDTKLTIVDEVHSYSGVFGSNAAFLFRRLRHLAAMMQRSSQYIGASATISDADAHLRKLFGAEFDIVGPEHDSSPRHTTRIRLG